MNLCLNLGCGKDVKESDGIDTWINLDMRFLEGVDCVCDIQKEEIPFNDEYFDYVFAQDIIEHFPLDFTDEFMQKVKRVIKVDGVMEGQVPNFELNYQEYKNNTNTKLFKGQSACHRFSQCVFGGQDYEGNFHFQLFDEQRLKQVFEDNGFEVVSQWTRGRGLNILGKKK